MDDALPLLLYTARQSRAIDGDVIAAGTPGLELMNRAGEAVLRTALSRWPDRERVAVVCGIGNNGGDGFVFARRAVESGLRPRVLLVGERERIRGDALAALEAMEEGGVDLEAFRPQALQETDYVVDALFGTGLERPLQGPWRAAVEAMNACGRPILAVDLPSGLQADTGAVLGVAVRATVTVTFIVLKRGMFTHQGPDHCGEILFDDLHTPEEILQRHPPAARRLRHPAAPFPPRLRDSHKGRFGHVCVIGGDVGYSGAARMAAEAALRVGAGLVSVATRAVHAPFLNLGRPELMVHPVETAADLAPLLQRATVLVLGPGLGQGPWAEAMIQGVQGWSGPLVVDADALRHLSALAACGDPRRRVFTPHPGEAARLLGTTPQAVQADRFAALERLSTLTRGHWVLKGCGTLVSADDGVPWVCVHGNPGMASGGMGDVLSGVLGGLAAQAEASGWGEGAWVPLGVALHARAGDLAAEAGERGLSATDLFPHLRRLVNE